MSKREPGLELLLRGGELIAASPLSYAKLRSRMEARLRAAVAELHRASGYMPRDSTDPGLAILDALAACLDVMGFYHDRILTESKLGAALRLEHVARLGEFVGYTPSPPLAATAQQFFEAAAAGLLVEGMRVSGPGNVVFRTRAPIPIGKAFNRMPLSPIATRQAGATRVVLAALADQLAALDAALRQQFAAGGLPFTLPLDDLRAGMQVLINGPRGLELGPVESARRGGVALRRPLLRSYDQPTTTVSRATQIRHLRFGQPLGHDDSLIAFEASREPILHLPDPAALERLNSTLEVFVFDDNGDVPEPEYWDPKAAWSEVADFSASEAADKHYRTFVDDRLATFVLLRRKLGWRELLSETALGRVYARYVPAVGCVPGEHPVMALDRAFFETALVRPVVQERQGDQTISRVITNQAGWAVVDRELGLSAGDQVAVLGGPSGRVFSRTLTSSTRGRYLHWSVAAPRDNGPVEEHDPIPDAFDVAKAKVAPLADVASGPAYLLWDDYYKQARVPSDWADRRPGTEIPGDTTDVEQTKLQQRVLLHKGSTFILLGTSTYVKSGDYLLIGRRLVGSYRKPPAENGKFELHAPWLTAEVVQAVEVQGNLIRLRDPVGQDFVEDRLAMAPGEPKVTEVVVVARVASVYYGDRFAQQKTLSVGRAFAIKDPSVAETYVAAFLNRDYEPARMATALGLSGSDGDKFAQLFLAVSGEIAEAAQVRWSFSIVLPKGPLLSRHVAGLWLGPAPPFGEPLTVPHPQVEEGENDLTIRLTGASQMLRAKGHLDDVMLGLLDDITELSWGTPVGGTEPLGGGQFRVVSQATWYFSPLPAASSPAIAWGFLAPGGALVLDRGGTAKTLMHFPAQQPSIRGLCLSDGASAGLNSFNVLAVPSTATLLIESVAWAADWVIAAEFHSNAPWLTANRTGTLFSDASGSAFAFDWDSGQRRLTLPLVAMTSGTPLDPLHGASRLWAVPVDGARSVASNAVTSELRFLFRSAGAAPLTAEASVLLALAEPKIVLRRATVEAPGSLEVRARLSEPVSLGQSTTHVLYPTPGDATQTRALWYWTGGTLNPAPEHGRCVAFTTGTDNRVRHATSWVEEVAGVQTLRLIPEPRLGPSEPADVAVHRLVQVVEANVVTDEDKPFYDEANKRTIFTFTLPGGWLWGKPLGTLVADDGLGAAIFDTSESPSRVGGVASHRWMMIFAGEHKWGAAYPISRDWSAMSQKTLKKVSAVELPADTWPVGDLTRGLGALFTPALDTTGDLVALPDAAKTVATVGFHIHTDYDGTMQLLAPRSALAGDTFPVTAQVYALLKQQVLTPASQVRVDVVPAPTADRTLIGYLGIQESGTWVARPLPSDAISTISNGWSILLDGPVPALFPGGSTPIALRLAYDWADVSAPVSTGLALHAMFDPRQLVSAGVADPECGANTALLHSGDLTQALVTAFTPGKKDWLPSAIKPEDLFNASSRAKQSTISFAQRFVQVKPESIFLAPLTVQVGSTVGGVVLGLQAGDVLGLRNSEGGSTCAAITAAFAGSVYELGTTYSVSNTPASLGTLARLQLRSLRARSKTARFATSVDLVPPPVPPARWLVSFQREPTQTILDSLLRYEGMHATTTEERILLRFSDAATQNLPADCETRPLFYYTDQIGQLRRDLYLSNTDLPSSDARFLREPSDVLLVTNDSKLSLARDGQRRVLLASKVSGKPPPWAAGDVVERVVQYRRELRRLEVTVFSESIIFNSGNFIPVTGMAEKDGQVIKNALRVSVRRGTGSPDPDEMMEYDADLARIVESIERDGSYAYDRPVRKYSFNKVPGGAFTLNFLLIDNALTIAAHPMVMVQVEYGADRPNATLDPKAGPIYQFETTIEALDPHSRLVVLDSGGLRPDDYLFLRGDASSGTGSIQWTRITSVTGPAIDVSPALNFQLENFRHYLLRGFLKPAQSAGLDKAYYLSFKDLVLDASDPVMPLADRLVVDPVEQRTLLSAIAPGDRLLVWDERYRDAWKGRRAQEFGTPAFDWSAWPDRQHEVSVKSVDYDTGLLVLTEPLPVRFAAQFTLAGTSGTLTLAGDGLPQKILPAYRAPFQGTRRLHVLGSGDKSHRFPRYTGVLATSPGLASVPLTRLDTYTSNFEVFTKDARSGDWTRWLQFASIDAAKKDPAFVLGIDGAAVGGTGPVPFSVSFGDGKEHGLLVPTGVRNVLARTTSLGPWGNHVPRPRRLRVLHTGTYDLDSAPFVVPPEAIAARTNLKLTIDAGGAMQWAPSKSGASPWRPELLLRAGGRAWPEVTAAEACAGKDGVYLQRTAAGRPSVLEVFFFSRVPVDGSDAEVWALPDGGTWVLDQAAYEDLEANDPTCEPGSERLQILETEGVAPGSMLAFTGGDGTELVRVKSVDHDTWRLGLEAPLQRAYALATTTLRGNIVEVFQGDARRSVIGSGDGSTRDLRLPLFNRARLIHRSVSNGVPEPDVEVRVDGVAWTRRTDLSAAGPRDRVYGLDIDADGVGAVVVFGDGVHGAVPPPGVNNIEAVFAMADAGSGNLPVGVIAKLVDGSLAVKSTSNITESSGGRPADTVDEARGKLLGRNVGYDRIVALDDVSRVARQEIGEVIHARMDPTAPKGTLLLGVALRGRREPTAAMLMQIRDGIAGRMPATAGMTPEVTGAVQVSVHVIVEISTTAGASQGEVLTALERAFAGDTFFAAERWPLAEPLRLGDLYEAIFQVKGVALAHVTWMSFRKAPAGVTEATAERAERLDPGPRGVIRCDTDRLGDPSFERGSIRFEPKVSGEGRP